MSSYSSIRMSSVSGPGTVERNSRTDFGMVGLVEFGIGGLGELAHEVRQAARLDLILEDRDDGHDAFRPPARLARA